MRKYGIHLYPIYVLGLLQIDQSDNFDATFSQVFLTFDIQNGKFITGPYWTHCLSHDLKYLGSQNPKLEINIPILFKSWDYLNPTFLVSFNYNNFLPLILGT